MPGIASSPSAKRVKTTTAKKEKEQSVLLQQIQTLQRALASSSDLNPLSDLLVLAKKHAHLAPSSSDSAKAVHRSIHILTRSLRSLAADDRVLLDNQIDQEGYLLNGSGARGADWSEPEKKVADWIRLKWNESVELLCALLGHDLAEIRITSLELLFELQVAASSSLSRILAATKQQNNRAGSSATHETNADSQDAKQAYWSLSPWRAIVLALIAGPPTLQHFGSGESGPKKHVQRQEVVPGDVRQKAADSGFQEYDDVRYAILREISTTLRRPSASADRNMSLRANTLSLLLLLTAIPTQPGDLNNFLVAELSVPLLGGSKSKKGKKKGKGPNFTEDGDSEEDGQADEDDMMDGWFSDSDDEGAAKGHKPKALAKQAADGLGTAAQSARKGGRKRGPPGFHEGLHSLTAQKAAFSSAWLDLLLPKKRSSDSSELVGGVLSLAATHEILVRLHGQILPHLSRPTLLHDFLVSCLNSRGATALLALNAIFTLVTRHNLDYPQFYTRLYALLDSSVLHMRYRARFLRLLDVFLSSTHLPASLVASFAKRLSRLSLRAPPAAIAAVLPFVWNLLKRHPRCLGLIHKEWEGDRLAIGPAGVDDPFDADETDPHKTNALESSLWELASFGGSQAANAPRAQVGSCEYVAHSAGGEAHYLGSVTSLAKILAQPFTKERYELEDFLDLTYGTMFETETGKTLRRREARNGKPPPVPALVLSLAGGEEERVDVFPTQHARARAEELERQAEAEEEARAAADAEHEREGEEEDEEAREEREAIEALKRAERAKRRRTDGTGRHDVTARLFDFGA